MTGVTVAWNVNGTTEEVDFTTERRQNVAGVGGNQYMLQVPPERDYDRRAQLIQLLPGQKELREEARQYGVAAAALKQNPRLLRTMAEAFVMAFGFDAVPAAVFIDRGHNPGTLPPIGAGVPMFREVGNRVAIAPNSQVTPTNPVYMGVSTYEGQAADGPVRVTGTGDGGGGVHSREGTGGIKCACRPTEW